MKRHFFVAIGYVLSLAQVLYAAPPITRSDWSTYNHDVRGWRFNAAETSLSPANAKTMVEKWRFPSAGSSLRVGTIHATPTVVNGHAYFGTATYPAFYKLRPDGSLAWTYRLASGKPVAGSVVESTTGSISESTGEAAGANPINVDHGIVSSALVTDDKVYFGNNTGVFFALNRFTGEEVWKIDTRAEDFPGHHTANAFMASPILADGLVIVGGGSYEHSHPVDPDYECCTGRGFVIALEPDTGATRWKYDVGEEPQAYPEPIVIQDAKGKHTFKHGPSTSSVWSTPSYDEATETIYFGTDVHNSPRYPTEDDPRNYTKYSAAVIAVDVKSGMEKWVTQLNQGDIYNLRMSGYDPNTKRYKDNSIGDTPKVYSIDWRGRPTKVVGVGCKNGGFYVLSANDGEILTHTPIYLGEPKYPLVPEPDPRMIAPPSQLGGIQTGCATDGKNVFTNGIDWLLLNLPRKLTLPRGGRVVCVPRDLLSEHWRHERPQVKSLFGSSGDPVGSGIALGGGLACFTTTVSKKLVVLDAKTGEELKSVNIGTVWSGPSISRGRIYVGTGSILFLGRKMRGTLHSFGLPGPDEVDAMGTGDE